jgi:hypothetical protein
MLLGQHQKRALQIDDGVGRAAVQTEAKAGGDVVYAWRRFAFEGLDFAFESFNFQTHVRCGPSWSCRWGGGRLGGKAPTRESQGSKSRWPHKF